jgi:hypothetical protein
LGPFADLGCKIVFTKTSVTVYHPDGHPILSGWWDETGPHLWHFPLTTKAAQVALDKASPQLPIPLTAEAAHLVVDEASHPPQLPILPPPPRAPPADVLRTPRKGKWRRRKLTRTCHVAVKQSRHTCPRQRFTFILPPSHINKDSTAWRHGCSPNKRTTFCINPLTAHSPSPTSTPLPGHPHPSHGILATSTSGAACLVYYIYGVAQAVALAA